MPLNTDDVSVTLSNGATVDNNNILRISDTEILVKANMTSAPSINETDVWITEITMESLANNYTQATAPVVADYEYYNVKTTSTITRNITPSYNATDVALTGEITIVFAGGTVYPTNVTNLLWAQLTETGTSNNIPLV